ncbi:leishmanolysin-related zinc metalloendopeptidase [Candidatus Palauibacter sp.]|uniref:leishmanolysin-related zinc metalloendopeptidase n=1 Tax=Candidatus Palauibacter sp. TaxID=3101350 RepID=UPI003B5CEFC7
MSRPRRAAPGRAVTWTFAVLAVAWAAACGDGSTEPPLTRPPMVIETAPDLELAVGDAAVLEASAYFSDPEGGVLSYEARSSDPGVATPEVTGSTVRVIAVSRGTATVTVTARDPEGRAAALRFEVTVPNRAPLAAGPISALTLIPGDTVRVDPSEYFTDPDGDPLVYEAESSGPAVVSAAAVDDMVRVVALARGSAIVTVTARDPGGLTTTLSFGVEVRPTGGAFDITLDFVGSATEPQRAAIRSAADLWMSVLADTELPDVPVDGHLECHGARTSEPPGTIDDLMILVEIRDIDGPGRTLAQAGMCRLRDGSMLPHLSVMFFDASDLDDLIGSSDATELAVHEIAHTLGFGLLWPAKGLLRDRSFGVGAIDSHFTGPLALAAFDAAGGTDYTGGAKVPVENLGGGGSANLHWRGAVLRGELMRPLNALGAPETFSAITIQSMADLGYTVDVSLAEPYTLPARRAAAGEAPGRVVDLGDDVLTGPLQVVDPAGRVVRVLRNR